MNKIRILVLEVNNAGVGKYRFTDPHTVLQSNHRDEFLIDIMPNPPLHEKDFVSNYDVIVGQGTLIMNDSIFTIFEKLKKDGMKIILDLDDYWRLPPTHALYKKMEDQWKTLTTRLKIADLITTTTEVIAKEIVKYNRNVVIIPNAINPEEEQFTPKTIESERTRIGWIGGSSHLEDLKLLSGLVNKMQGNFKNEVQMVMAGFNNLVRNSETGEITESKRPKVWMECEMIFTNKYMLHDNEYQHYLLTPRQEEYPNVENKFYRRIWTKPIQSYADSYNNIDIALAPLRDIYFNKMKSQLKMIEAGFHKKALIASKINPYEIDGIHGKNCYLVEEKKSHKDFFDFAKKLVRNPQMRIDMGEALYETVKDKYNINNVTKKRAQAYKNLF
jgi:glycosyltransferase involved in cell wall biosynthesis